MSATTFIYCLCEPGSLIPRYFGKADNPAKRLKNHLISEPRLQNCYSARWIRGLQRKGARPDMHVLCKVPANDWERFERAFIAEGRQCGMGLTNLTDGGEGASGYKLPARSPEHCAKISARQLGKKHSPEQCAKQSAAHKGKTWSPEHRAKMVGRKHSPEHCAKIGAASRGLKQPDSSSKFIGVFSFKISRRKPWRAAIRVLGKNHYLGLFVSEYEAALAYDKAAKEFHREKAKLNFPNG